MKSLLIASLLLTMAFAATVDVLTETTTFTPLIDIQPDQVFEPIPTIQQPAAINPSMPADRSDSDSYEFSDSGFYSDGSSSSYEDYSSGQFEIKLQRRSFRGFRDQYSESSSGSYESSYETSSGYSFASSDSYEGYSDDFSSYIPPSSYGGSYDRPFDSSNEGSQDFDYSGSSDSPSDSSSDSSYDSPSDSSEQQRGHGGFGRGRGSFRGQRGQKRFGKTQGHQQEGEQNQEPKQHHGPKGPRGPIDPFKRQVFETLREIEHTVQDWQDAETVEQKNLIRDQVIQQFSTLLPIVDEVQASTINMRFAQEFARPPPNPEQNEVRTQLHQVAVRIFTEWQQATDVTIKNQIREELIQQVSALFPQN